MNKPRIHFFPYMYMKKHQDRKETKPIINKHAQTDNLWFHFLSMQCLMICATVTNKPHIPSFPCMYEKASTTHADNTNNKRIKTSKHDAAFIYPTRLTISATVKKTSLASLPAHTCT